MEKNVAVGIAVVCVAAAAVFGFASRKKQTDSLLATSVTIVDAASSASVAGGEGGLLDQIDASGLTLGAQDGVADAAGANPLAGIYLGDGGAVPPLPDKSPKSVRCGIILVTYAGAQGAPANARSKKDALELAQKLSADAKTDFKAAVARGDSGSADDVGRVPRGVLEPAPEYVLFTIAKGDVSEPLDTPRGYWIAKRID